MVQPWYYYAPYHDLAVGHPPRAAVLPQHFLFANAAEANDGLGTVSGPVASMLLQALSRAVQRDDLALVQRLLLLGAELDNGAGWFLPTILNGVDAIGCTLLQRVCVLAAGSADHMKGFSMSAGSAKGVAALEASGEAYLDILTLLLQAGADVNARDIRGATALHYAAVAGNLPMTQLLLRAGAKPHLLTDDGSSALLLALESGAEDVARVLLPSTNKPPPEEEGGGARGGKKRIRKRRKRRGDEAAAARLFMQPPAPAARLSSLLFHAVGNGDLLFAVYLSSLASVPSAMQRPHPSWWCAAASRNDQLLGVLLGGARASSRMLPLALLSPSGLDSEATKAVDVAIAALRHASNSAGGSAHGSAPDSITPWGLSDVELDSVRALLEGSVQPLAAGAMGVLKPKPGGGKGHSEEQVQGVLTSSTLFLVPSSGAAASRNPSRGGRSDMQEVSLDVITRLSLGWPEEQKPKMLSKLQPPPYSPAVDAGVATWDARHTGPLVQAFTWQGAAGTLGRLPSLPGYQSTPRTATAMALGAALGDRGIGKRSAGPPSEGSLWVTHLGAPKPPAEAPLHATTTAAGIPERELAISRLSTPAGAPGEGGGAKGKKKDKGGKKKDKGGSGSHVLALHVSVGDPVLLAFGTAAECHSWLQVLSALCLQRSQAADCRSAVTRGGRWLQGATFTLRAHVSKQRSARKLWLRQLAQDAVLSALAGRERLRRRKEGGHTPGEPPLLSPGRAGSNTREDSGSSHGSAGGAAPGSGGDSAAFKAYKLAVPRASSAGLGVGTSAKPAPIFSIAEGGEEEDSDGSGASQAGSVHSFHTGDSPRAGVSSKKTRRRDPPPPPPRKKTPPAPPGGAAVTSPHAKLTKAESSGGIQASDSVAGGGPTPDQGGGRGSRMRLSIKQRPPAPTRPRGTSAESLGSRGDSVRSMSGDSPVQDASPGGKSTSPRTPPPQTARQPHRHRRWCHLARQ